MNARLSICIPTYRRADVLGATLETILAQTHRDFELVVVDNASPDATPEVVAGFRDPRLRYERKADHVGILENHNRAISEARGDLIALFHDHDLYGPDIVRRSVEILERNPNVGLVCSAVRHVDAEDPGRVLRTEAQPWQEVVPAVRIRRQLLREWPSRVTAPTVVVRRVCFERAGMYDTSMDRIPFGAGGDRELWLRIFREWDLGYIAEPMARLRMRVKPTSFNPVQAFQLWDTIRSHVEIQRRHTEWEFREDPFRRFLWRQRLEWKRFVEFWRWALWSVAKKHDKVSRAGVTAAREAGMRGSAALLKRLHSSSVIGGTIAGMFRMYKAVSH